MHHPTTDGSSTCAMQAAAPLDGAVLASLLGSNGCLVAIAAAPADLPVGTVSLSSLATPVSRFAPPDLPPPRL
jgi:hypothetical protein